MKKFIAILAAAAALIAPAAAIRAATSAVSFDAGSGMLSIAGSCSSRFVLVVIRNATDGSIWGSSDPECANGGYAYAIEVPDADRQGGTFDVQAYDEDSAGNPIPSVAAQGVAPVQPVIFAEPVPVVTATATIAIDTSSVAAAPDDMSLLDAAIAQFFGIVADAGDAVQSFATVVANSVKATVVAAVNVFAKNLAILPGGSLTLPHGENQLTGEAVLATGAGDIFIANTAVASSSKIFITPTTESQAPLTVTQKLDGVGFHVGVVTPQSQPVAFDWLIIQTYAAAPASGGESSGGGFSGGTGVVVPAAPAPAAVPDVTSDVSPDATTPAAADVAAPSADASTTPDAASSAASAPDVQDLGASIDTTASSTAPPPDVDATSVPPVDPASVTP
ncbi:MAG TPA: hypothetical protein VMT99_02575 [Candidatus Paceibacterota bacterium]|nr:hypothetical protein [Candidatus Paceibacterota bacterium]